MPKEDVYRAKIAIKVFESIGFVTREKDDELSLMGFGDAKQDVGEFMIQHRDVGVLHQNIRYILEEISFPIPYFDYMYAHLDEYTQSGS